MKPCQATKQYYFKPWKMRENQEYRVFTAVFRPERFTRSSAGARFGIGFQNSEREPSGPLDTE
jgi:hypothetical protein